MRTKELLAHFDTYLADTSLVAGGAMTKLVTLMLDNVQVSMVARKSNSASCLRACLKEANDQWNAMHAIRPDTFMKDAFRILMEPRFAQVAGRMNVVATATHKEKPVNKYTAKEDRPLPLSRQVHPDAKHSQCQIGTDIHGNKTSGSVLIDVETCTCSF